MVVVRPKFVIWKLYNVTTTSYGYISAKMKMKDYKAVLDQEKPKEPYVVVQEDNIFIFYLNSPIGCYRIELIDEP